MEYGHAVATGLERHGGDGRRLGHEAMQRLRYRSVCAIDPGLTDDEFDLVEREFGFQFADDHRGFLSAGLPTNARSRPRSPGVLYAHPEPWPDWRNDDRDKLRGLLEWPTEGVLFDVEKNGFWYDGWGPRPAEPEAALATATSQLVHAPTMVPVYGHRYLPAGRGTSGHPVLSLWQTDIIVYGLELADYIYREFGLRAPGEEPWEPEVTVDFWRDLV